MYLKNLFDAVSQTTLMPLEISELAAELVRVGCQDQITFIPVDVDPREVRGIFYRYTQHPRPYADPELVTLIVYSKNIPLDLQRIVCCKELIHTCDSDVERTNTEEEVQGLLDKLLGPLSTEDFGMADIMAAKDKLALYQALSIVFPDSAREQARELIAEGRKTVADVARWVCLPVGLVELVLGDEWLQIRDVIITL